MRENPQRVDQLSGPPTVGKRYLVPIVFGTWTDLTSYWPVMGPLHDDAEHLDFAHRHYHFDFRFLTRTQLSHLMRSNKRVGPHAVAASVLLGQVAWEPDGRSRWEDPAPPTMEPRRCYRSHHQYPRSTVETFETFRALFAAYDGRTCNRGKHGFICPHRNFPLGSIEPVNGIITCPLHGLSIDATTGKVCAQTKAAA